ncbi:MAG: SIS domain-containing protein [Propionibacteriales bacterium]|nr:SIS domain-containing protein [Propionibacteriales bacterium]
MTDKIKPATSQMAREIAEQPEALAQTLDDLLPRRGEIADLGRTTKRLLFIARGSSDNASVVARYLGEVHAGLAGALAAPSVANLYAAEVDLDGVLAISVSQSGSTQEIVDATDWARRMGARTLAVTNVEDSPLAQSADLALITRAGRELAVPATKTFTTQVAALTVAIDALAREKGILDAAFAQVPAQAESMINTDPDVLDEMVAALSQTDEVLTSGRGITFGITLEAALKLEETCLRPVRGLSYADLKHGPMAIVDAQLATLLVAAGEGPTLPGLIGLAEQIRGTGSPVLGLGGNEAFRAACDLAVPGPDLPEAVAPICLPIPAQLLVERLARALGLDPDAPRGLK